MSPMTRQTLRIHHLAQMTGIQPGVLDVPPAEYDALKQELSPLRIFPASSLEPDWHTVPDEQMEFMGVRLVRMEIIG